MLETLLLVITLIVVMSLLVMLGEKLHVSYPIFLVVAGIVLSFIPGLPVIHIDPELIFLIFLPPLLYEAAWFTSWKDFWKWRRVITTLAFGLVILTSTVVAWSAYLIIPGFTLALGFLLGGIVSPPDAVAATSVLKRIHIQKRIVAILEGESLVNDATSLIIFRFALAAVMSGSFVFREAAWNFVVVAVMGVVVGIVIGILVYAFYKWLPTSPSIDTAISFVAPYLMYIIAETFHFSGVMAVVSGGLFVSYRSHLILSHASRMQGIAMWSSVTFVLNGLVFILIGLELRVVLRGLENYSIGEAILYGLIISVILIIVRILTALGTSLFTMFISRYIRTNDPRPGWKGPLIIGWAGMRGVVSLAAALSLPLMLPSGDAFPHRNLILFITFIVILVTLVFQGLTLPYVISWLHTKDPDRPRPEHEQEADIHLRMLNASLKLLDEKYSMVTSANNLVADLREELEKELRNTSGTLEANGKNILAGDLSIEYSRIFKELNTLKREVLLQLRNDEGYDDHVIRKMEARLDIEELRHKQLTGSD
ncbi:Na+/H+ antiporter [Flavihumibacter solisilvae]|uniref:Sodium:hydrogen antiporter n=1 Tax=Flavihumibacter solisilvae TaxID=1349421 RepID=A0A0C1L1M9_9BACT|nr:Na+/H+ antiporter [Flavihumibacter solisilvae]KIC93501.1 sodium:hydrogen antiporter [Flavihumibacter solisilvae]